MEFAEHAYIRQKYRENRSLCVLNAVPVNSVDAHNEGLYIGVRGTAELAAGLSTEWGAIT